MRSKSNQTIYSKMQRFADVTKTLMLAGNFERAKHCIQVAEDIFNKGTTEIRNAVTNVYLFSVSGFMEIHNYSFKSFLPEKLNEEYCKQVNSSGV